MYFYELWHVTNQSEHNFTNEINTIFKN